MLSVHAVLFFAFVFSFFFLFSCVFYPLRLQESSVFNTDGRASREHHAFILQPRDGLNLERISGTFCHAVVDDQNSEKSLDPTEFAEYASAPFSDSYSSLWIYFENGVANTTRHITELRFLKYPNV